MHIVPVTRIYTECYKLAPFTEGGLIPPEKQAAADTALLNCENRPSTPGTTCARCDYKTPGWYVTL